MSKTNRNIAEAAESISKAKSIIEGPFRGMTDQITEQNIQLPLIELLEVVALQNEALEKLRKEVQKLVEP
jgi:hypothetical protein